MAVYTHLGAEALGELICAFDVGDLVSAKGIAEGVSNSNWLIDTTGATGRRALHPDHVRRADEVADLPFSWVCSTIWPTRDARSPHHPRSRRAAPSGPDAKSGHADRIPAGSRSACPPRRRPMRWASRWRRSTMRWPLFRRRANGMSLPDWRGCWNPAG
jgi:hypothetical protein